MSTSLAKVAALALLLLACSNPPEDEEPVIYLLNGSIEHVFGCRATETIPEFLALRATHEGYGTRVMKDAILEGECARLDHGRVWFDVGLPAHRYPCPAGVNCLEEDNFLTAVRGIEESDRHWWVMSQSLVQVVRVRQR